MPQTANIRRLFNSIAPGYDALNHILSLGIDRIWRRRAVRFMADPSRPQYILDLACGTGDLSLSLAKRAHPDSHILGLDISEGMLAVMRRKVSAKGFDAKIEARIGDACSTGLPDNSIDAAGIAFGIRNFEDREAALREIHRVLKPGGTLTILELSVPGNRLLAKLYKVYFLHFLPLLGGLVSGDRAAYRYLPASVLAFPPPPVWTETMCRCGFGKVTHKSFTSGICRMYIGEK